MQRTSLLALAIVLLLTALPFTAAAKQQPWRESQTAPAALPAPSLPVPPDGTHLGAIGPVTLQWNLPAGATQYHLQVTPFSGEGPGVNLIRSAESQFTIPAPPTWYVLLPAMTYTWRVRVTDRPDAAGEGDPSWSEWSPSWRFQTPVPSAATIQPSEPQLGTTATSLTPTLVWTDSSPGIFYYEVQLSADEFFTTDAFTATAAVYWNLVHGGVTQPYNSWAVPASAQLERGKRYYWRVRPRVQGNGTPVNWGLPFWFVTRLTGAEPDLTVTNLELSAPSVEAGRSLTVMYTVKNIGPGDAPQTDLRVVLSPDVKITRLDQDLGPVGTVPPLGSQQSHTDVKTVTIPSNQPVGSYFLGVFADWALGVAETDESNNGLGQLLAVTEPPSPAPTATALATPSPAATGRIAFTWQFDRNLEIYVMNVDGSGQTNLTNNLAVDLDPAWSPGGRRIAFTSYRDGNYEIYVMNADGSGQTRLTNSPASDAQPAWSPDGGRIAFESNPSYHNGFAEIYVMNADGSGQTRLTNNQYWDSNPAWSPDGGRIAFYSDRDGNTEIYVVNADGSGQTNLTNNPARDDNPAWSPDGQKIAFGSYRDGNYEIYVMNADGSGQTRLTNNQYWDSNPTWSPDGQKIAFESSRDGNLEIYVMNADGSGQTRLTNNRWDDSRPAWSPR